MKAKSKPSFYLLFFLCYIITLLNSCKDKTIITDIDGNVYHSVTIGTQVWMVENLKTTKYRDGSVISNITNDSAWSNISTGAYCDYNNDETNSKIYGRLYNWYAINDIRKIAPIGWHVATDADWLTLTNYLGGDSVAGGKLKEIGIIHWNDPNADATNESGFTALPAGSRFDNGNYSNLGYFCYFLTSSEYSSDHAMYRVMSFDYKKIYRDNVNKKVGFSVRCVKD